MQGRLYGCPVELSLVMLGGKWKTVVLARLKSRPMRYGELRRAIPELAEKVLTGRLRELEQAGFVTRVPDGGGLSSIRYGLTERGRSLAPVLEAEAAEETGARFRTAPVDAGKPGSTHQPVR